MKIVVLATFETIEKVVEDSLDLQRNHKFRKVLDEVWEDSLHDKLKTYLT